MAPASPHYCQPAWKRRYMPSPPLCRPANSFLTKERNKKEKQEKGTSHTTFFNSIILYSAVLSHDSLRTHSLSWSDGVFS